MPRPVSDIEFFGEIDLNEQTKKPRSEYPAWYFDVHIEALQEGIERKQRQIDLGVVPGETILEMKAEIEREQEKLDAIKQSRPKLTGPQKDKCYSAYQELGKQISDTMPTRKQDKAGLVNPYDELKRLKKTKHISIDPDIAKSCNVKPVNGKVTGNEAAKCFQMLGRALGESSNVESLRRDGGQDSSYKIIDDLTKAILEGKDIKGT